MIKATTEVVEKWMQAVNQGDVEGLISLYDASAVLIPTFSNRLLNTPDKLRDYFEKLGSREGLSIDLHERTLQIQEMNDDMSVASGIYTWHFEIDGEPLVFEARFSYVIDLSKPNPILHHHSSQIPRML